MRWILSMVLAFFLNYALLESNVQAASSSPYSGFQVVQTTQPFNSFAEQLTAAIKKNKMGLVAQACANCGAKSIGVTIPGNRVFMIFRPDFAVRMLAASEAAGIEAPLRLYVTEQADGNAQLSYRLPSHTFGDYNVPELDKLGAELDVIIAQIVNDALK
ncbi:DUF302 domain-containing protein [Pelagibius sp. Alg239-R121]|uniref:DUF302 domain-containing protein n=1 Tax=Pelagibius sp. Alg239-R121 TaxID=2993448 RepID=UPI0024A63518|nr:DUF302 domain-containing protein [Pelagibius sp. Alg239-R121]